MVFYATKHYIPTGVYIGVTKGVDKYVKTNGKNYF